ncbi:hypothetical protein F4779DRAFT_609404 [Xylariaceae sp. FL0662B]|nr:hypothetical protein F4779DRAFT_609404 [Xylariaceae sp. FL0662B]
MSNGQWAAGNGQHATGQCQTGLVRLLLYGVVCTHMYACTVLYVSTRTCAHTYIVCKPDQLGCTWFEAVLVRPVGMFPSVSLLSMVERSTSTMYVSTE